jgi:hypothetical protein
MWSLQNEAQNGTVSSENQRDMLISRKDAYTIFDTLESCENLFPPLK